MPKFQFDYRNKDINLLNETTYSKFILTLLDKKDEEKIKFNVNLLDLSFLGEELYTTSIYLYPILIFEFMNGYYTTTELYEQNIALVNANKIQNIKKDNSLKIGNFSSTPLDEIRNEDFLKGFIDINKESNAPLSKSIIGKKMMSEEQITNIPNIRMSVRASSFIDFDHSELNKSKEKNKSKLKINSEKKIDCIKFFSYFDAYIEKIIYFRDDVKKKKNENLNNNQFENCENMIEIYKRKERMIESIKLLEYYKNKREEIKKIKLKLYSIISNKKTLLTNLNQKIISYKEQCQKLEQSNNQSKLLVAQNKMIYNSFLNKKMVEICFFFFNKKIKNLYLIPDSEATKKRSEFYNSNKKRISSMMGYITQLMIYFSKCFDIPLPFPLCLNGSKCSVVRGKKDKEKDFLPLYCDLKREDKYGNFETGLNYLKNDFNEIINFCSMFPQIWPENIDYKIKNNNENNEFFFYFIKFNHCLQEFIKNIQKKFDI